MQRRLLLSNVATIVLFLLILGFGVLWVGAVSLRRQVEEGQKRLAVLVAKDINVQYDNAIKPMRLYAASLRRPLTRLLPRPGR